MEWIDRKQSVPTQERNERVAAYIDKRGWQHNDCATPMFSRSNSEHLCHRLRQLLAIVQNPPIRSFWLLSVSNLIWP